MARKKKEEAAPPESPVEPNGDGSTKNVMAVVSEAAHGKLKLLAGLYGVSMGEMVVEAVDEYLNKPQFKEALAMYAAMQAKIRPKS